MEFPELGQACVVCKRNDYLPFKCTHCCKTVCVDHKTNHGVECPLNSSHFNINDKAPVGDSLKRHCDHCKKITLKLELVECLHCKGLYCLYHRHQVQHDCQQLVEIQRARENEAKERIERQQMALNKLKDSCKPQQQQQQQQQPQRQQQTTNQPLDPKKLELAKRLRVMKIKQFARGPPNILQDDKIFFLIKFKHEPNSPISNRGNDGKELKIFTTAKHTVGRMIDWSSDELNVQNKNHIEGASQLVFKKFNPYNQNESITLNSQVSFAHYLNSGELENGDELVLTYII